jgi:hypothetical protein
VPVLPNQAVLESARRSITSAPRTRMLLLAARPIVKESASGVASAITQGQATYE